MSGSANHRSSSSPQDLLYRFSLRQFVDELIEAADVLQEGVFDLLYSDAAEGAFDFCAVWRPRRRALRERSR